MPNKKGQGRTLQSRLQSRFEDLVGYDGRDDRGLSPVVSVILMIAVAVVVVGAIATFMIGLGGSVLTQSPPQAQMSFSWDANTSSLTVTHDGGPQLTRDNTLKLEVWVDGDRAAIWADANTSDTNDEQDLPVQAGDSIQLDDTQVDPGDTVRIVWIGPDSQQTETFTIFDIPG